jgi:tripartite-type tricarboxylate transporter receptor subunit TctC
MTHRRQFITSLAGSACLASVAPSGLAQSWPTQPLRIVVPFAPGGTSDVIARLITKPLSDALGVSVVVENRTGAAGNVGAGVVANATDGHTVLLSDLGSMAISPLINKDLPFKAEQLQGVTMLAYSPHILAVHPSVQANTLQELVALSKRSKINAASAGSGTPNHLGVVDIALNTGMRWQHVPYRGGAQAINDTVAGTTQLLLNGMVATWPLVQAGKLKAIGVSKSTRMAIISHVPTLAEQGAKGFESGTYQGVLASTNMSAVAVERLNKVLIGVIRSPEIRARLVELGAEVQTSGAAETTRWVETDRKRWASVIQRAGKDIEGNV